MVVKTKDFLYELEENGYRVNSLNERLLIHTPEKRCVGEVNDRMIGCTINYQAEDMQIAKLIFEYGMTPIEDRVEEKKYNLKLEGMLDDKRSYLNVIGGEFNFNTKYKHVSYRTEFTESDIANFPYSVKRVADLCKEIEVTE